MPDPRPNPSDVRKNQAASRFVLDVDGRTAFIDFRETPWGEYSMTHTEVPKELEGHGIGSALVTGALDRVREEGATVLPHCPFVHAWIRRHPDYVGVVSERYRRRDDLLT